MNQIQSIFNELRMTRLALIALTAIFLTGATTGCQTTRQARSVTESGFLRDYSQLQPGGEDQAKLRYIAPNVPWLKYKTVCIMPVELWKSNDPESALGKLSPEDQKLLVDMLHTSLRQSLQQSYLVVDRPGPDTIIVHSAVTMADRSAPVRNLVSTVMPIGLGLSVLKAAAFGKGIGVGDVQVEMELLDGTTHQRLAAAVDRRVGTKALRSKFDGSWGDVQRAFAYWAERLENQLIELRAGKAMISN
jgi:hypothetical protein